MATSIAAPALYPQPVPGIPVKGPVVPPAPGAVLLGYQVSKPQAGCCKCDGMSSGGMIAMIVLILLFWPLAWIPCVMQSCFEDVQRPVYGNPAPGQAGGAYPVAQAV